MAIWASKTEQDLKKDGVKYNVCRFLFLANSRTKMNPDTEGQVKFLVEGRPHPRRWCDVNAVR